MHWPREALRNASVVCSLRALLMHTGKSTLAQQLASRLNLPNVLQTDIVYEVCPVACSQHCMSLSCIHALPQEQACCSCMSTDESDVLLMLHDWVHAVAGQCTFVVLMVLKRQRVRLNAVSPGA